MKFLSPDGLRKSRLHDEKGNFVDPGWVVPAAVSFATAAAKRLFGHRPMQPMISLRATRVISDFLKPHYNAIEFGSGMSTPWLAKRVGSLLSIEDDPAWAERVKLMLMESGLTNVCYALRDESRYADLSDVVGGHFHFALVDGTDRRGCIRSVLPKMAIGGIIYLDNCDKDMTRPDGDLRVAERTLLDAARSHGWPVRYFTDFSPTNFFAEQGVLVEITSPFRSDEEPAAPHDGTH